MRSFFALTSNFSQFKHCASSTFSGCSWCYSLNRFMSLLAQRNYMSSSEEEDESVPILGENQRLIADSYLKDQIFKAVYGLNHLVIISFWTAIIVLSSFAAYASQGYQYQLYIVFIALWLGHILFFVQLYRIYSRIQESLLPTTSSAADVDTPKYFTIADDIEELIPLTLFVVHNVTWIFGTSLCILIAEILFFFYFIDMAPAYGGFVPLYILLGMTMSTHLLCKSANLLSVFSVVVTVIGVILINVKLSADPNLTWVVALSPFNVLVFVWFLVMMYVLICFIFQYYRLKVSQIISMILYSISFLGYLLTINFLTAYLLDAPGALNYQLIVTLVAFIVSTLILFVSVWIDVRNYLNTVVSRLGNELPVPLRRVHPRDGSSLMDENIVGYDADPNRAVRCFILLGEIEMTSSGEGRDTSFVDDDPDSENLRRSLFDSFFTSCCTSTIEMLMYSKSKRKRRSGTSSSSGGGAGASGGAGAYERYGSDSTLSSPRNSSSSSNIGGLRGPGRASGARGSAAGGFLRRSLESSDDDSLDEGDEGDEEGSYDRQKQREFRQKQAARDRQFHQQQPQHHHHQRVNAILSPSRTTAWSSSSEDADPTPMV